MNVWLLLLALTSTAGAAGRWYALRTRGPVAAPGMPRNSLSAVVLSLVSAASWVALFVLSFHYHL